MNGADWFLNHRDEFVAQRDAVVALRAKIAVDAATQAEARKIAGAVQQFSDDTDRIARLDEELRAGKPVENMTTRDIQFLIGSEDKKRLWNTFGSNKRQRWQKAIEHMPQPPADASEHVVTTYVRLLERVHERKRETVRGLPKQAGLWYRELARREVITILGKHIPPCSRHCTTTDWSFILDSPSCLPADTVFDPAGNFKQTATKRDATDEDEFLDTDTPTQAQDGSPDGQGAPPEPAA